MVATVALRCMKMEQQQATNYFITLCGISGSGKSTLSKELAKTYDAKLYSYDDIMSSFQKKPIEVRTWILESIKNDLQSGFNVVLDDLNILEKSRREILEAIQECNSQKILAHMNTPLDMCLLRNSKRKKRLPDWIIKHMHRKYQSPTLDEGWDEIRYY